MCYTLHTCEFMEIDFVPPSPLTRKKTFILSMNHWRNFVCSPNCGLQSLDVSELAGSGG